MTDTVAFFETFIQDKRLTYINDLYIVTDELAYTDLDQVLPMYDEQLFFFAELNQQKIQTAHVLEIGLGSGVLSIGCIKAGAKQITALEISPRAQSFAKVNIGLNHVDEGQIKIVQGDDDIFKPVAGEKFDYIISNPPFEPTPVGGDNYLHSEAGMYGIDFLIKLFKGLDDCLTDMGHAQIVTGVPGNDDGPSLLIDIIEEYLPGQSRVVVNPVPASFATTIEFQGIRGLATAEQVEQTKQIAQQDGITQYYLVVIHYNKGPKRVTVETATETYPQWGIPLDGISMPKKNLAQLLYQLKHQPQNGNLPEIVSTTAPHQPPANKTEQRIALAWQTVLKRDSFSVHDNFFEVGGESVLVLQLHSQLSNDYPTLKLLDLFSYPTIYSLATYLKQSVPATTNKQAVQDRGAKRRARQTNRRQKPRRTR